MIALTARRGEEERANAVSFAVTCAELLGLLATRRAGSLLRLRLSEAANVLQHRSVSLVRHQDGVRANEASLPPRVGKVWMDVLTAARVTEVRLARDTSERELLLFLALLCAPGDAVAFDSAWLDSGGWRIHVISGADVADTTPQPSETASLLEELAIATNGSRRRALFEAIIAMRSGQQHIISALSDRNWYMVRNAVALVGELRILAADSVVVELLRHEDPRVRVATATTLGQLDTSVTREALLRAVGDAEPRVRAHAWTAWARCSEPPDVAVLDFALRSEQEAEVHHALLECCAAFPHLDVCNALQRFCAREFSRRGTISMVLFAVEQLALRKPESARQFLQRFAEAPVRVARA